MRAGVLLALALALAGGARADELYEPPTAGSYELPPIDRVSSWPLLDADGQPAPLLALAPGEAAIVSFGYRSCAQSSGCPAALAQLSRLDRALSERPALARRVELISLSFDPRRDTPEHMAELRGLLAPRGRWRFLTAASRAQLAPVLEDFGQDAVELLDAEGAARGEIRHVLKLFLVDDRGRVRNVYSAGFARWQLMLADLETLALEADAQASSSSRR